MSRPTKSLDVQDRMGVYKCLADVPERHRLHNYDDAYAGREVWQEFCERHEYDLGASDSFRQKVDRAGDLWREHMNDRGRHHALATPGDVEAWSRDLTNEFTCGTSYKYWIRVEHFYRWLQWHTEHPHVYHPPLIAAAQHKATADIWQWKADDVERARRERR